jgi:hypothetical protein
MSDKKEDDKKKDKSNMASVLNEKMKQEFSNFTSNIRGFIVYVIMAIITILFYFSASGLVLFVCKVAQSNILPTDDKCTPYADGKINVEKIKTNIFTSSTDPKMSMKLEIPYDYKNDYINNSKYFLINMIKKYKDNPKSHYLVNYLISIVEPLMQLDYTFINFTMTWLNFLPEYLIVYLGPIIVAGLMVICFILNVIYFCYLWFANLGWMFKININFTGVGKPWWQSVPIFISPTKWFLSLLLMIIVILIFFFGTKYLMVIPFAVLSYCIITCVLYAGLLNGKNVLSPLIVIELFKYYKLLIISLIIFSVIPLAFLQLGILPGIVLVIILIICYCQVKDFEIFKPTPEINLSGSVGNEQAKRTCTEPSFITKALNAVNLFSQKGGNITKELKNISKNLNENNLNENNLNENNLNENKF